MRYLDDEIVAKLKSLPRETRESIINCLVKMVADRPRDLKNGVSKSGFSNEDGGLNSHQPGLSRPFNG